MKPTKDFLLFQKEFKYWQQRFGLTGYKVYFKYQPILLGFASLTTNEDSHVATVCLNSNLSEKDKPLKDVKGSAKHEAIHLMLGKFQDLAFSRYLREGELYRAEEEIVFKLEELIT